jgi:hypothetical protein
VRSNRDGVGAALAWQAGGARHVAQRLGGGSYLSASDPRQHLGLGAADHLEWLEVRWPSGVVDRYEGLAADTGYRLREGESHAQPLQGWRQR